jgi:hypothetical protein
MADQNYFLRAVGIINHFLNETEIAGVADVTSHAQGFQGT